MKRTGLEPAAAQGAYPNWNDDTFWHLLRDRRSIRRYQSRSVPRFLLEQLLEAANWAPSAHNRQPWRFCVVTDQAVKEDLSGEMADQWRRDLRADGTQPEAVQQRIEVSHARITGAAALLIACVSMEEMDSYPDRRRNQAEWTMAVQSVALACQNLLLAAHHLGLGACWMCAPLFVPDLVRRTLALPSTWQPQALITVGYPAEERTKIRQPVSERVIWREDEREDEG